jgi:hypothetical protein
MNVSTGGPHLLFFERNQQLITLLTSEFRLTGYECHAARTAVEVFDTIARHPVQLVLVNLAQAAAGRREFWVALDAQRRGRGVQVFTYRCINLAGYGADDLDEREHGAKADIEVDGMLGVMNLVDAVRARLPATPTGSLSRVSAAPVVGGQAPRAAGAGEVSMTTPSLATSVTSSFSAATSQSALSDLASSSTPPHQQPLPSTLNREDAKELIHAPQAPLRVPTSPSPASKTTQSYTDKVRAIIYPSQTTWNPPGSGSMNPPPGSASATQSMQPTSSESGEESSLSQLSRLLQMHYAPMQNNVTREARPGPPVHQASNSGQAGGDVLPAASAPISSQPLRASPIQDLPIERAVTGQRSGSGAGEQPRKASSSFAREEYSDRDNNFALLEQVRARQEALRQREAEMSVASDNTLLDIVKSLPPMPSPPAQPLVLSGRATRSLGSVLLEGHLVPHNRLEVAQNVQRMLRGVDLNYQLGEILLMFKLLTPDQLLAASLVSYGLITTAQISALGRIRQELHSIGLEYDLENLLILFRILTPEQLREVLSTWS